MSFGGIKSAASHAGVKTLLFEKEEQIILGIKTSSRKASKENIVDGKRCVW